MAQSTVVAITVINVIANFFVIRKELIYILKLIQPVSSEGSDLSHWFTA